MYSNNHNKKLSEYLATELAAWQTYQQAAEKVQDEVVRDELQLCESSHRIRAQKIKDVLEESGVEPQDEVGVWNSFATFLAEGVFTDKDAVQLLEEEEELGLKRYQEDHGLHADGPLAEILSETLLPQQSETHDAVSILRISLQAP